MTEIVGATERIEDEIRRKGVRLSSAQRQTLEGRLAYETFTICGQHEDGTITVRGSGIGYGSVAPRRHLHAVDRLMSRILNPPCRDGEGYLCAFDRLAEVRLCGPGDDKPVPGSAMCRPHAEECIEEYREKLGEEWTAREIT